MAKATHGDRTPAPVSERIMRRVAIVESGCWIWQGGTDRKGYGMMRAGAADGFRHGYTHRLSYETFVGPIPDGLVIDHLCRVPPCCNPAHLEPVTTGENSRRGIGPSRRKEWARTRTHCFRGHEFTSENILIKKRQRSCRQCERDANTRYRQRKRQQREAA